MPCSFPRENPRKTFEYLHNGWFDFWQREIEDGTPAPPIAEYLIPFGTKLTRILSEFSPKPLPPRHRQKRASPPYW